MHTFSEDTPYLYHDFDVWKIHDQVLFEATATKLTVKT